MRRDLTARITLDVTAPADLVFSISASGHYTPNHEQFTAAVDGEPVPWHEVPDIHGTRLHRLEAPVGRLEVAWSGIVLGAGDTAIASETDLLVYVRPSRYCESDTLAPTAHAQFDGLAGKELLDAVSSWVGTQLSYVSGSSLPTDGAVRTLLARQGVCRDYAHLTIALLRALGVPARLASVYAPGLAPMDFHAVAEAWVDDAWRVVDATALAPRASMVRIATGRDASDTAWLNVVSGTATLVSMEVGATVDDLPVDDVTLLASLS